MENITVNDFVMFIDTMKAVYKITPAAKIDVSTSGTVIRPRNEFCRCEIVTNSIVSENPVSIVVGDISKFVKLLSGVESIHNGDYSNVRIFVDGNYFKVESKKFKTKFAMTDEDKISSYIGVGFKRDLNDVQCDYSFITNSDYIKRLNNQSFMFSDLKSIRVYIKGEQDMNRNTVYATIGDDDNDFENSVTFEFGMLTDGAIGDTRIILDFDRLNAINVIHADEITIRKPSGKDSLFAFVRKNGKNGSFSNMSIVSSVLVK